MKNLVILSAARTPIGSFLGSCRACRLPRWGRSRSARPWSARTCLPARSSRSSSATCSRPGRARRRPARPRSGPASRDSVPCVTVHKVCGSGMRAVMDVGNAIQAGEYELVVAGGMESMSNAPYLLEKGRTGLRMGHGGLVDSMIKDGLWDPYGDVHMGSCAEKCVAEVRVHPRGTGRLQPGVLPARAERHEERPLRRRDRARRGPAEEGRPRPGGRRRGAVRGAAREDADAEAVVSEGRHDHRRQLVQDQRRRRRPWSSPSEERAKAGGWKPIARIVGYAGVAQAPGVVHDRAGRRRAEAARADRPLGRGHRPLRDQRGLRRGRDGGDPRARTGSRRRSTSAAAPWRSGIPSGPPARAS